MHQGRNGRIAFRCIAVILTWLVLPGSAASQDETITDPPGFHLYIRLEDGKTTYKLGEAIQVQVSCKSDFPQRYTSACGDDLRATGIEVEALDSKGKLALDSVETVWIARTLCPTAQYRTDYLTGEGTTLPAVGPEVRWSKIPLYDNYPMSAGRFRLRAVTRGADLPNGRVFSANSMPVEVRVVDDPQWRAATLREAMQLVRVLGPMAPDAALNSEYAKVQYMPDLEALHWLISENGVRSPAEKHPNRAAAAKFLREYLDTKVRDIYFKEELEEVLALELAAGSPKLYRRAVAFQGALGEPSVEDLRDLRAWLLPRYRRLMLEVARSMVTIHKRHPDDFLEYMAEGLVSLNVPECPNTRNFLSQSKLRHFMRAAGLSSQFITEQIAKMRKASIEMGKAE